MRLAFMDPLVLAIAEDTKTVTRRMTAPRCKPGDVIDVCEALVRDGNQGGPDHDERGWIYGTAYRADGESVGNAFRAWPWKVRVLPARYCPSWAVRHRRVVVGVRPEFLTAITDEDAWREGIARLDGMAGDLAVCRAAKAMGCGPDDPRAYFVAAFRNLHNLADDADPTVFRIEFQREVVNG